MKRIVILLGAISASLSLSIAGEFAPTDVEIAAAVKELGSDAFETRDAAFKRLLAWGEAFPEKILPRLPEKSDDPDDPDFPHRCASLREQIKREVAWSTVIKKKAGNQPDFVRALNTLLDATSDINKIRNGVDVGALGRLQAIAGRNPALLDAYGDACVQLLSQRLGGSALQKEAFSWLAQKKDPRANDAALVLVNDLSQNDKMHRGSEELYAFAELRAMAMGTLGETKDKRAGDVALARLKDNQEKSEVREAALLALQAADDPRALDTAVAYVGDFDEEVQCTAIQLVQEQLEPEHAKPLIAALEALFKSAPASIISRRGTGVLLYGMLIDILGDAGNPEAVPLLAQHLEKFSPENLRKIGAEPKIDSTTPSDNNFLLMCYACRESRARAAVALGKLKARGHAPKLLEMLKYEEDPYNRVAVVTGLGLMEDRAHLAALEPLLKDPDAQVRQAARTALEQIRKASPESR